ncbi:MAG: hypothetical protein Q9191_006178 [Dirinaria sp. TL-2023a]
MAQSLPTNPDKRQPIACGPTNLTCMCGPTYRAATAACEEVSCSPADYDKTQTLASQLCASVYSNGPVNPTSVSAAIATSTAAAAAAVASKDPTNPASYPSCGEACINQNLPSSGCGSLANRACICQGPFNINTGRCELATCSQADITAISYLAYHLCNPAGGIGNTTAIINQTIVNQTAAAAGGSKPPTQSVQPFTGGATALRGAWVLGSGVLVAITGLVVLL